MKSHDAAIERAAQAGYEAMLMATGMFVNKHPWENEPEDMKRDWRTVATAILEAYGRLRTADPA